MVGPEKAGIDPVSPALQAVGWLVSWLLNDPATCEWISGIDLLRQLCVLPH